MITVLKINWARGAVALVLAAALAAQSGPARAESSYFTTRSLLQELFPRSQRVTYRTVEIAPPLRARLVQRLGYALPKDRYTVFVATTDGRVDGYAVIDEEPGQHLPITFGIKLSPRATVERVEIVTYREPRGDEVRDARFRRQFVGKTAQDPVRLDHDIDAVSGATISSAALATGVRRAVILVEEAIIGSSTVATAAGQAQAGPRSREAPR